MWHTTCMQGNWGNSWLLVVGSQIANLIFGSSFGHNLCLKCPNGSCEPILDIYVPRTFQWYKKCFNLMAYDPCNHSLKIRESIGTPTPKVGAPLGVWWFIPPHSPTLPRAWDVTPGIPSWLAPLQALALVVSPRLKLRHPPSRYRASFICFLILLVNTVVIFHKQNWFTHTIKIF
jgi:hypothetical protein